MHFEDSPTALKFLVVLSSNKALESYCHKFGETDYGSSHPHTQKFLDFW